MINLSCSLPYVFSLLLQIERHTLYFFDLEANLNIERYNIGETKIAVVLWNVDGSILLTRIYLHQGLIYMHAIVERTLYCMHFQTVNVKYLLYLSVTDLYRYSRRHAYMTGFGSKYQNWNINITYLMDSDFSSFLKYSMSIGLT